jgi:hypothetical protein
MSFFDNPSAVWDSSGEVISFSDENGVVRYLNNHVIEFVNYRTEAAPAVTTVMDDYVTAVKFIKDRDRLMENGIYFAGFEDDGEYRYLHFDYYAGEFPVMFTQSLLSDMGDLKHGITFTFRNGVLVNYKRLAYSFGINETLIERTAADYLAIMDANEVMAEDIERIAFAYYADAYDPNGITEEGAESIKLAIELIIDGQRSVWA